MSRSNIVKMLSEDQKWDLYKMYLKNQHKTKKAFAKEVGVSTRTLGRIIEEFEATNIFVGEKSKVYDYSVTKNQITIFCNEESRSVVKGYPKFSEIKNRLVGYNFSDEVLAEVYEMLYLPSFVDKFSEGNITVDHESGKVWYGTFEIKNSITDRMMGMLVNNQDVLPLVRFLDKLMMNPKANVVTELYSFLNHNDIEISEEGDIIAYRSVKQDWTDFHTGTMDNSVGSVVSMPRTLVNDNPNITCSSGLHCSAYEYAASFGGSERRLVKVKVCPSDVVSVPVDYNGQKLRSCKFEVIEEIQGEL